MDDDPTADFLAREQAILGADAALFGNPLGSGTSAGNGALSPGSLHDFDPSFNINDIDQLVPEAKTISPLATNRTGESQAQTSAALLDDGSTGISFANSSSNQATGGNTIFNSFQPSDLPLEENTFTPPTSQAILDWQVTFDAKVVERDAKAKEKHDRMVVEAKEALERFYAEYNEKKAKSIARNKELEAQTVTQMEAKGNVWEQVLKQIEITPKMKVEPATGAKKAPTAIAEEKKAAKKVNNETMRFKQVLTSLKSDPKAPGLQSV